MSQCKIYLENYDGRYYAGSEIRGRLECFFDDVTTIRGIKVRLKCKEHNEWTSTESYTDPVDNKVKTRCVTLTGDKNILFIEQMLFGSDSGTRDLHRGRHVYPFSYTLPYDIPSTFKGPHGGITYKLKGIVDRPMRVDYEDSFIFVVESPIDFNTMFKEHQEAVTYSDEKTVCCWCCKGGDVTMDVELPKTAFVPGETVNFQVTVSNLSNSNVEDLSVKLIKTLTYRVTSPDSESKEDVEHILTFTEHGVGAHGEHTYDLQLEIPKYIDVPNFTRCDLFNVSYELQLSCEMPACTMDLDISVWNIKMGHIQYVDGTAQRNNVTPGFISNSPPADGAYVPLLPTNPYPGGGYSPPAGGNYPPGESFPTTPGGPYPPPAGGSYLPPSGSYPPPAGGPYPPAGGSYPPPSSGNYPLSGGNYPLSGGNYPPSGGNYAPSGQYSPSYPPNYPPGSSEKPAYPSGQPTAPNSSANAPFDYNPKAREAAGNGPSAPYEPGAAGELPPPSYDQIKQNTNTPFPPQ